MKKKALSLALTLVMCLGLTVPVFADSVNTAELREGFSLTGVVGEEMRSGSPVDTLCYKVNPSATLVISGCGEVDESGGAFKSVLYAMLYEVAEFTGEGPSDWSWDQRNWVYGDQIAMLEWTENGVYTFDRSLVGKTVVLSLGEDWESTGANGGNGVPSRGHTIVLLQFLDVDAQPEKPLAKAGNQDIEIDGTKVAFQTYMLADENGNGTNYVKLRDIAHVLNGTGAQFSVGYNRQEQSISAATGTAYKDTGTEMDTPFAGADKEYVQSNLTIVVDGKPVQLDAITLTDDAGGGYNYFKLRDLGDALGFTVGYSRARGVYIETK